MTKTQVHFRFKEHPGDLFRNTDILQLPHPDDKDSDNFLVQFLKNYQTDHTIAYLNDLYKLLYDEFSDDDKANIIETIGNKTLEQVEEEIETVTAELYAEAYKNFYKLVLNQKIEIIYDLKEK